MYGCRQTQAVVNGWLSENSCRCEWMAVGKLKPLWMDGCRQTQAIVNGWLSVNSRRCESMAVGKLKQS